MILDISKILVIYFSLWLQNRLISAGLELVLIHTEKSCILISAESCLITNYYFSRISSEERGHWTNNYTGIQSFLNKLSYELAQSLRYFY